MRSFPHILALVFLVLFVSRCVPQESHKIVKWELKNTKTFSIQNKDNVPAFVQYYHSKGKKYVLFYNDETKKLLKYDFEKGNLLDSIPVNIISKNDIWAINYVSQDSIFIAYNASGNKEYNHSGTIVRINEKGELKQTISLKGFPIQCNECGVISKDSLEYITLKYGSLLYSKNNLYVQFESYYYHPGDSNYVFKKMPVSGHISLKSGETNLHKVFIPSILGKPYPKRAKVPSIAIGDEGNPVIAFSISSRLYSYNIETKSSKSHYISSFWGDTLMPYDQTIYKSRPQDDYTQISFRNIIYDPYRKIYIRFSCLPMTAISSPQDRRNPDYSISVIDKNFNLIAEGILPKNLSPTCFITEENIYFWDREKNPIGSANNISFSGYNLSFITGDKNDLIKQLRVRDTLQKIVGFEAYVIKNFKIPNGKSAVFFIPVSACKPCISAATKYATENQSKYPIYLVFGAENSNVISAFTSEYTFNDKSKVFQDSTLKYEKFLEPPVLNGIIGFFENGKMVKEIKILPGTSEQIKIETKKFLDIK